ncbi:hypothetical protein [Actinophytocola sp.]|uniref:hypothetical protein n=1 Tax=Actinophytocola sp. TaxID=1872138 RepID=UPI003D6B621B
MGGELPPWALRAGRVRWRDRPDGAPNAIAVDGTSLRARFGRSGGTGTHLLAGSCTAAGSWPGNGRWPQAQ